MTTHKPSADHPWKRDRYQGYPVRQAPPTRTDHDKAVLQEIRDAVTVQRMPILPSPLTETQFGEHDMVVLSGEGCRQKKALRYG